MSNHKTPAERIEMKALFALMLAVALTSGCQPKAQVTQPKDAQALVDSLEFVKQKKTGLCFGVATTSRLDTSLNTALSVVLVSVDCAAVGMEPNTPRPEGAAQSSRS